MEIKYVYEKTQLGLASCPRWTKAILSFWRTKRCETLCEGKFGYFDPEARK